MGATNSPEDGSGTFSKGTFERLGDYIEGRIAQKALRRGSFFDVDAKISPDHWVEDFLVDPRSPRSNPERLYSWDSFDSNDGYT